MPNEEVYQKSVQKKIRYCLGVSQFIIVFRLHAERGGEDFEMGHFRKFRTSVTLTLTLDGVISHTIV